MKAIEIAAVFEQIAPISLGLADDRAAGNLGFRIGDSAVDVTGVGVAWYMSTEVVQAAVDRGLNLLIIHEPDLWRYWASPFHSNPQPMTIEFNRRKMKQLMDHGICVYTAHTNWDLQMEVGMGPTLAATLGFTDRIKWDIGVGVYRIDMTFGQLIAHVKKSYGLDHVRCQGEDDMAVRTVVVGFGSIGSEADAIFANCADAGIFGELREWPFLQAREAGVGIIETTHLRSESIGFASVVREMRKRLPSVRFEFLETAFPYRLG